MSEKLQLRANLTLEKAVEMARQFEMVKSQIKDQSLPHLYVEAVHRNNSGAQGQRQNLYSVSNRGRSRGRHNSHGSRHSAGRGQSQNQEKYSKCNLRHNPGRCFAKGNSVVAAMGMITLWYAVTTLVLTRSVSRIMLCFRFRYCM
jgi:hypothetical protein